MDASSVVKRRRFIQWLVLPVVVITIALGWKWPILGFSVPIVMIAGIVGSFFRGRYVCGNLCPRGAFLDRLIRPVSKGKPIPTFIRTKEFRWTVLVVLMGGMAWRISLDPTNVDHLGRVFWMMCVVTTTIAVIAGLAVNARFWCAMCPMGTMQNAIGGGNGQLEIDPESPCKCKVCEKVCPMNLQIVTHRATGVIAERDCIKCSECVAACPPKSLSWPGPDHNPEDK